MNRRPTLPGRHRRPVAVTVLAALTAALVAAPASAAGPSPSVSAWVVARQAGAIGTPSTPGPKDQGNSTGGTNTVTRTAIGEYEVVMPGVGGTGGTVQVTPLNSQPRWCFPTGYGSGQDLKLKIFIRCTALNGALASSKFVATYTVGTGSHGTSPARLGYALTDDTGRPGSPARASSTRAPGRPSPSPTPPPVGTPSPYPAWG